VPTQRTTTVQQRTSLYEDATSIVESDYAAELSLDLIARRVASSRRQLQRVYAEIGNTTFREHLTDVRMRRAADLLRSGGLTVREVANRVGYRQPAQFAKAFRRSQGVAPSGYRALGGGVTRALHDGQPRRGSGPSSSSVASRGPVLAREAA
jgi:AraC family transcriptional regulator of adaptative response / methylphosphotriester-DNA alkyltransferase methyltransferase